MLVFFIVIEYRKSDASCGGKLVFHVPYARLEKLESSTLVLQEPRLN